MDSADKLLTNCNVVDVENGSVAFGNSIAISKGIIMEVGNFGAPKESSFKVIDMEEAWVIPGLIDLHTHPCEEPDPQFAVAFNCNEPEIFTGIRASRNLEEAVKSGITTIRDVGAKSSRNIHLKGACQLGILSSPDIKACGILITYPGGHMHDRGIQIRGEKQARLAVKKNVDLGADFIKVASDPQDVEAQALLRESGDDPSLTIDELRAVVGEAHKNNLKVACHSFPSVEGLTRALDAGIDTFEHAVPLNDSILNRMLSQRAIIVPTFVAAYDEFSLDYLKERMNLDIKKASLFDDTNYPKGSLSALRPKGVPESISVWLDYLIEYLPVAIEGGIRIGIGSDAGCAGTNFRSAIREMFYLTQFGASNLQVLQYATMNGEAAIGVSNLGSIHTDFRADLVFLKANPLNDISALLEVKEVMSKGNFVVWD